MNVCTGALTKDHSSNGEQHKSISSQKGLHVIFTDVFDFLPRL